MKPYLHIILILYYLYPKEKKETQVPNAFFALVFTGKVCSQSCQVEVVKH